MIRVEDINVGDLVARKPTNVMWLVISKRQRPSGERDRPIVRLMDIRTHDLYTIQYRIDENIVFLARG
jgi:hypothetical protein